MTNFIRRNYTCTCTCILQIFHFETNILKRELAIENYFESYFRSEYNKSPNAYKRMECKSLVQMHIVMQSEVTRGNFHMKICVTPQTTNIKELNILN